MSEKKIAALSTKAYKGTRDFYPEDMSIQQYIFGKMRQVAESFGYLEYEFSARVCDQEIEIPFSIEQLNRAIDCK